MKTAVRIVILIASVLGCSGADDAPELGLVRVRTIDATPLGKAALTDRIATAVDLQYRGPKRWIEIVLENGGRRATASSVVLLHERFVAPRERLVIAITPIPESTGTDDNARITVADVDADGRENSVRSEHLAHVATLEDRNASWRTPGLPSREFSDDAEDVLWSSSNGPVTPGAPGSGFVSRRVDKTTTVKLRFAVD